MSELRRRQQSQALAAASARKRERTAIKEKMKLGKIDPALLIEGKYDEHEHSIKGWRLRGLLLAIPLIGPVRVAEILEVFEARETVRLGSLSWKERKELAQLVREAREVVVNIA